ncbi:MAG: phosphatase PAP2 family protein [Candidatus Sericytochromatia bacterium]|nr:phosphatase PAP2 family protein [Candidatus Tanganyikabacteria bacterium]
MVRSRRWRGAEIAALGLASLAAACGSGAELPGVRGAPGASGSEADPILKWNEVAAQCVADDHTGSHGPAEQGGPTLTSRAMAIVHLAMYDAFVEAASAARVRYPLDVAPAFRDRGAVEAAVAQACHDTLVALYPRKRYSVDRYLERTLAGIPVGAGRQEGVLAGSQAAAAILAERADDGAEYGQLPVYPPTGVPPLPGQHQPDPTNPDQGLLSPGWGHVRTFSGLDVTAAGVRAPSPPGMTDPAYAAAYEEVKRLGGDAISTATERTAEQTEIGLFWAYDGTAKLGAPPRFYNQLTRVIARQQRNSPAQNARLFALVNLAMADAGIACWDSKYFYNLWRPIVGIRQAETDGNGETGQDATWTPLGAPASNRTSDRNFTPPFPAYPSGHAAFGAATLRILRHFYGTDTIAFALKSDELSGRTTDYAGNHRSAVVRRYRSFSDAIAENARSRIYLGIHWAFDADEGIRQGIAVADHVHATMPLAAALDSP